MSKKTVIRHIIVDNINYLWFFRKPIQTEWYDAPALLEAKFYQQAKRYGLGQVANVSHDIIIKTNPAGKSQIRIRLTYLMVDGFLGPEKLNPIQVTPSLIAKIIKKSRQHGWNPTDNQNYLFELNQHTMTGLLNDD